MVWRLRPILLHPHPVAVSAAPGRHSSQQPTGQPLVQNQPGAGRRVTKQRIVRHQRKAAPHGVITGHTQQQQQQQQCTQVGSPVR
jgi:hypothetical protein